MDEHRAKIKPDFMNNEYALGSARESRDWYYKGRHILGEKVAYHRMDLLVEVIRQLLVMIPKYRQQKLREAVAEYTVSSIAHLLSDVPMPD